MPAVSADASGEEGGLLGKLPRSRPRVETPVRTAARDAAERRRESAPPAPEAEGGRAAATSGFEQLARAGAGLAGGAAAAGFRLAGRAVGEIGKAVGRS